MKSHVGVLRSFIAGAMLLSLIAVQASADQSTKIPRIGVVFSPDTSSPMEEGLRQGFRDSGYSENLNIIIDWRRSGETGNELKSLILDLTRLGADLLVVFSTPAAHTTHEVTTIPVVALVGDPVGSRLAGNLARPDRNITGVSLLTTELTAKRIELLHQMVPNARALRNARLPAIYPNRRYHDEGALMSYGPDVKEASRRLASFVDRILKGAKAEDLPFEQVAKFELIIDTRIAREQRIKVPQELLLRADEVLR